VKYEFLADRPEAVNLVAGWYFEEWGRFNPEASAEKIATKISHSMNRDKLPLLLLAIDGDDIVGAVELKFREMDIYPDMEHWLGGLFVLPEYRGRGVGKMLASRVIGLAHASGVRKLYLQTEHLSGGIYAELGWSPIERVQYKGANVLVMELSVGA
jgi:GNAT superfamily N-acetyltransferase